MNKNLQHNMKQSEASSHPLSWEANLFVSLIRHHRCWMKTTGEMLGTQFLSISGLLAFRLLGVYGLLNPILS